MYTTNYDLFLGTYVLLVLYNLGVHAGHAPVRLQHWSDKRTRRGKRNLHLSHLNKYFFLLTCIRFKNIEKFIKDVFQDRYKENMDNGQAELLYSFAVSIFAIGGMLGGFSGGIIANRFGRLAIYVYYKIFKF